MNKRFCDRCGNEIVETKRTVREAFCDAVEQGEHCENCCRNYDDNFEEDKDGEENETLN